MIIRRMRSFARLTRTDRMLLLHAGALHAIIAVLCRTTRFGALSRALARVYPVREPVPATPGPAAESRAVWAATTAAACCPFGDTCLTRALTAQCLLRRLGGNAVLRFSVGAGGRPRLSAHAWLESAGRALAGLPAMPGHLPLE